MTIDEAIKHCEKVAERQEYLSKNYNEYVEEKWNVKKRAECAECASEHRQLAGWLRDLTQAKAIILEMSYTLEVLCDKVNAKIGCSKCLYSDGGCKVKSWLAKQRKFCKGGEDSDKS